MDEYNQGWDPEIKKYFMKIINSFTYGIMWMIFIATTGLYFRMGIIYEKVRWFNIVFYLLFVITLILLIRYLYLIWRNPS
jgi:hypothetical protein